MSIKEFGVGFRDMKTLICPKCKIPEEVENMLNREDCTIIIYNQNLYLKVYGFNSYDDANKIIGTLNIDFKTTTQNEGDNYSILLGPLENNDANKLVSSFISKGYKKTEIILE